MQGDGMSGMGPRVAILGFHLEANAFASPSAKDDFLAQCWEEGEAISGLARCVSHLPAEIPGFYQRMDALGRWTPVPLIVVGAPPGGPATTDVWSEFLSQVKTRLLAESPVNGVYIANHGASSAVGVDDTEAQLARMIRSIVGPDVPIIATHDLHCNVSEETVASLDALISYRTNPHIDQRERAAEAADLMHEVFEGERLVTAYVRLPITPPSVTLSTIEGPYADVVRRAESMLQAKGQGPIAAVSAASGFVFSDLPKCGMTVTVTARRDVRAARRVAIDLARAVWEDRSRYVANTIDVAKALELASQAAQPLLFADVADNPGGGGGGNTTWLLEAFDRARVPGVTLGVFVAPDVAAQAHAVGVDGEFHAVFNPVEGDYTRRYETRARVLCLSDGNGIGRRGILRGRKFSLGASALIELRDSGMQVLVGSLRRQLAEPAMLEMHGLDISHLPILIVKSRGHYRAGFDEFFPNERIHDVDSPGLTTPNLSQIHFKRLPRPVWPIEKDGVWIEPDWASGL